MPYGGRYQRGLRPVRSWRNFGDRARDSGHSRVPAPPAGMTDQKSPNASGAVEVSLLLIASTLTDRALPHAARAIGDDDDRARPTLHLRASPAHAARPPGLDFSPPAAPPLPYPPAPTPSPSCTTPATPPATPHS